jgi:hypothetical protein
VNARLLIPLLIALLAPLPALAKDADDYFHGGAYKYVAGKRQDALLEVEEGLRKFPADPRLKGLADQLRKLEDQDKNQSGDNDRNKDKKDPDKKDPGKDKDKDKDKKDEEKKDKGKDEGKDKDKQPPPRDDPKDDEGGKNPSGPRPGEMSREEAQRLLNSFAEDEKKEQRERQKLMLKRLETEQDW